MGHAIFVILVNKSPLQSYIRLAYKDKFAYIENVADVRATFIKVEDS